MNKKSIFLCTILNIYTAQAMDAPIHIKKADQTTDRQAYFKELLTHTIALPTDIKRYIFTMLPVDDSEFHDEFIARVKNTIKKTVPTKYYYKNLHDPEFGSPLARNFNGTTSIPTGWCPYETNVAVLNGKHLQIINSSNNSILYAVESAGHSGTHIALSSNAQTIATIHTKEKLCPTHPSSLDSVRFYSKNITIRNLITHKTTHDEIPAYLEIPHRNHPHLGFAFNKQGTHVIICGTDCRKKQALYHHDNNIYEKHSDDMPDHVIIPVTINEPGTIASKYLLCFLANQIMKMILPHSTNHKSEQKQ